MVTELGDVAGFVCKGHVNNTKWYHRKKSSRRYYHTGNTIIILNITKKHTGYYECEVKKMKQPNIFGRGFLQVIGR